MLGKARSLAMHRSIPLLGMLLLAGLMGGCKAGAAKSAGFVDPVMMKNDPSLPFHTAWKKQGFSFDKYKKVFVAPVDTTHLFVMSDWQKGERKDQFVADVGTLARFTENAIKKAYKEDPKHRMTVVDSPTRDADAVTLEVAIVEVVPSKVVLNALGYAPFFIGMGITAVRSVAQDVSTVAIEARFRDAATGEILLTLADREQEQMAVVSVRGLTWYSHAQAIVSQWATQFVQMASQKPGEVIKDSDPFTLQPW